MIYISLFPICANFKLKGVGFSMAYSQLLTSFMMFTLITFAASENRLSSISIVFMKVSYQTRKSGSKEETF